MKKVIVALSVMATFLSGQQVMAEGFDKMQKTFIETPKDQLFPFIGIGLTETSRKKEW
ncbi:MAG: hypothetical protein IKY99_01300 [Bacteroidaceae bacterium]|nr:hypothetical protein [Bacteroidaceae bacterium]